MSEQRIPEPLLRGDAYQTLASIFLVPPDTGLVQRVLDRGSSLAEATPDLMPSLRQGLERIQAYSRKNRGREVAAVWTELAVDRTQLLGGISRGIGPRPPYEAVFRKRAPQDVYRSALDFYHRVGFGLTEDLHQPPDHVGVELAFMAELCRCEAVFKPGVEVVEREFLRDHLGCWAGAFAAEVRHWARTEFYQGVADLLDGFIESELPLIEAA